MLRLRGNQPTIHGVRLNVCKLSEFWPFIAAEAPLSLFCLFSLPLCLAAVSFLQVMSPAAAHSELRMIFCNGRLFHVFIPSCSSFACRCSPPSYLRMAPFTCRFPLMTTHSAIIEMRVVKKKCESLLFPVRQRRQTSPSSQFQKIPNHSIF